MCNKPRLVYSERYKINVDLEDSHCTSARGYDFGKVIPMYSTKRYICNYNMYLHRIICDACVNNPRKDIFDVVDHIDGNTLNNRVKNLRWVNGHLNSNNLQTRPGNTPPGVYVAKRKVKSGKWYTSNIFLKNQCCIKSFRTLQKAVEFANKFNADYFRRLYDAYVNSPQNAYEARIYWAELAICVSDFRADMRKSRIDVLAGKFLFSDSIFKKLT